MHSAAISKIEVGRAIARGDDAYSAGRQAVQEALAEIKEHAVSIVLVFASPCFDLEALLKGVNDGVDDVPVVGATTAGEVCDGLHNESVVVLAIASPYLKVHVGVGRDVSEDWSSAVDMAVRSDGVSPFFQGDNGGFWQRLQRKGTSAFGMIFSPGNTRSADSRSYEILEALRGRAQGRLPLFGGSSADDWAMRTNHVFHNRCAHPDSLLLVVFETQLKFGLGMAHGFKPTQRGAMVTRARGHEALALNGLPADAEYAALLGSSLEDLQKKHLTFTTGKCAGFSDGYNGFNINVASFFTESGGVRFAQPVVEGSSFVVMEPESSSMVTAGRCALRKALLNGGIENEAPACAIAFSCALRNVILQEDTAQEIAGICEEAGKAPVAGFLSFGEQGITDDGANRHGNELVSVLALGQTLSPAAEVWLENQSLLDEYVTTDLIFNTVPDYIFLLDTDFRIIKTNRAVPALLGLNAEDILGQPCYRVIHGTDAPPEFCPHARTMKDREEHTVEVHDDNLGGDFLVTTSPLYNKSGDFVGTVHMARDITEQKNKERELETARKALEAINRDLTNSIEVTEQLAQRANEANHAKTQFMATMSHELRTPINGIVGMTEILLLTTELTPDQKKFVTTLRSCANSLMTLIGDILDFSKYEAGKLELESVTFNFHQIIESTVALFVKMAKDKNVVLINRLAPDVPVHVMGDPTRIRQILVNLVGNAMKFTDRGKVVVGIAVEKETDSEVYCKFTIQDTGIGIPEDKMEDIFQSFSQADQSTTRKYGGTGLGLTISKQLCELMGGRIGVDSEVGKGSTFWFTLKFKKQSQCQHPDEAANVDASMQRRFNSIPTV